MVLEAPGSPLQQVELPQPECGADDVLLKVSACGVCRTDLHLRDGE
jgi:propanol-preferring alcohol dehydrogenase